MGRPKNDERMPRARSRSASTRSRSATLRSRSRSSTASSFIRQLSHHNHQRIYSLYRLLQLELDLPSNDDPTDRSRPAAVLPAADLSYELLTNMAHVPLALEKFMVFGLLVCLNSLLTLFTLVPLKIAIVAARAARRGPAHLHCVRRDVLTVSLIAVSVALLLAPNLDISRMYHDVRGQAQIRLYVMFGVLEVADKLCSSLGHDILDVLYTTPAPRAHQSWARLATFYALAVAYLSFHSYVCIYQAVSLNVAANSYSNALLALLLSNQFAELKGSVFKKFEREGLFQLTMSDLTERVQLSLMLSIIALRNLLQLSTNHIGLIPTSWNSWNKWIGAIFGPGIVVLGSEILVDWLKHCYITKFNRVRPRVYLNFLYVLSLDFLEVVKASPNANLLHELTDYIVLTKRIGLPLLALTVCFLRMTLPDLTSLFIFPHNSFFYSLVVSVSLLLVTFAALLFFRLILGIVILKWANKIKHDHQAYQESLKTAQETELAAPPPIPNTPSVFALTPNVSPRKRNSSAVKPDLPPVLTSGLSLLDLSGTASRIRSRTPSPIDPLHILEDFSLDTVLNGLIGLIDDTQEADKEADKEANELPTKQQSDEDESYIQSPIELTYLPGVPNTEASTINPTTRSYLYDYGEKIPPTVEEKRNKMLKAGHQRTHSDDEGLSKVMRYEMSSKRIW